MEQVQEKSISLESPAAKGGYYRALFCPEKGMNLLSFQKDGVEVIDQSTRVLFDKRFAGLGALIGPHFHRRKKQILPPLPEGLPFPYAYTISHDPFSHGIARYASWNYTQEANSICARLNGSDLFGNTPLKELEGQDFTMCFSARLCEEGLALDLSVVSKTDSLVGLHYYYRLPEGKGLLKFQAKKEAYKQGVPLSIPMEWLTKEKQFLLSLESEDLDHTFHSFPDPCRGEVALQTSEYTLLLKSSFPCEENSMQIYHPSGSSFVCIEPISSKFPNRPNLTVSRMSCLLSINLEGARV